MPRQIGAARLGFDLDGVIADIVAQLLDFMLLKSGIHLSRESLISEDIETCTPVSQEMLTRFFRDPAFFTTLRPIRGARRLLTLFQSSGYGLHIVTDRFWYDGLHQDTELWLRRHGIPFDSLHFARKTEKQSVVSQLGLRWFVEDQLSNAKRVAACCNVLLVDRPYNQGALCTNVQRVYSLREVAEIVQSKEHAGTSPWRGPVRCVPTPVTQNQTDAAAPEIAAPVPEHTAGCRWNLRRKPGT